MASASSRSSSPRPRSSLIIAGATLATLTEAEQAQRRAEQHEAAVSLAQREAEKLRQDGWAASGCGDTPTGTARPRTRTRTTRVST